MDVEFDNWQPDEEDRDDAIGDELLRPGLDPDGVPQPPWDPNRSKRDQRRERRMDGRRARKDQKKTQKQENGLRAAIVEVRSFLTSCKCATDHADLTELALPEGGGSATHLADKAGMAIRAAFGVPYAENYLQLRHVYGPNTTVGLVAMGSAILRPPKYDAKFLPQEYSLLHKMWALLEGNPTRAGIVDIGAGNANCAVLAALLLGLTVICVERESPRVELRSEWYLPEAFKSRIIRIESDIKDFGEVELRKIAQEHGLDRLVLVAKHLCGIGTDLAIECADRLCSSGNTSPPRLMGVVMATCCTNKICFDDNRISRVEDFCSLYAKDAVPAAPQDAIHRSVETISRCSAWRTAAQSDGSASLEEQVSLAEAFEDALQALRVRRLRGFFKEVHQVRFAPRSCTLQDRCLVAGVDPSAVRVACMEGQEDEAFISLLKSAVADLLRSTGGKPIDVRPQGLVSERFEYDGTAAPPDD